jgi:hypothetical protein
MKRWSFILLGGFGLGLSLWFGFMLFLGGPLLTVPANDVIPVEIALIVTGVVLTVAGFFGGRDAAELDRVVLGKPIPRDHHVGGPEIDFRCPTCMKVYRASPMLAGRPFMCRECNGRFQVPTATSIRALPASAA